MLRLSVRSASGAPARVHLSAHGLMIIPAHPTSAHLPANTDTTINTPAELTFAGVGEADLELIDAGATLIVDATQIRQNAPPARRLTGRTFHVTRATYADPYDLTVVPPTQGAKRSPNDRCDVRTVCDVGASM
jgi:hypothetical protein